MAPRSAPQRPLVETEAAQAADFSDRHSQQLLDEMADALADALGEQLAIEYLTETGELKTS